MYVWRIIILIYGLLHNINIKDEKFLRSAIMFYVFHYTLNDSFRYVSNISIGISVDQQWMKWCDRKLQLI